MITLAMVMLGLVGCRTPDQNQLGSGSLAAIQLPSIPAEQVFLVIEQVFADAGFNRIRTRPDSRVFERPGGREDIARYGDFGDTSILMRATVTAQLWGNVMLVTCDVVAVRGWQDPSLEDLNPVHGGPYRKQYQALLDRVKQRIEKTKD